MEDKRRIKISKFMSLVLRHQPETIDLKLDESGWAEVTELLSGAKRKGLVFSFDELCEVVATNDKKRFSLSDDKRRIRANQGHSIEVDLNLVALAPPEILFHGTVARFIDSIRREGLKKQKRHHVHLSADHQTAEKVGTRRGEAIILEVASARMHTAGLLFYRSDNGVWLTDAVPPEYLRIPDTAK